MVSTLAYSRANTAILIRVCTCLLCNMASKAIHSICAPLKTWLQLRCQKLCFCVLTQTKRIQRGTSKTWVINWPKKCSNSFEKTVQAINFLAWLSSVIQWEVSSFGLPCPTLKNSKIRCMGLWLYARPILATCTKQAKSSQQACGSCVSGRRVHVWANSEWRTTRIWIRPSSSSYLNNPGFNGSNRFYLSARIKINMRHLTQQDSRSVLKLPKMCRGETLTFKWCKTCCPHCQSQCSTALTSILISRRQT